jgi:hypothetical protein
MRGRLRPVLTVRRLSAHAHLDETAEVLERAKAEAALGDESWKEWVEELERGRAIAVRIDLAITYDDQGPGELISSTDGLFVEGNTHAAKVEQQVAELASGDIVHLGRQLIADGHQLDADDLGQMYVHVELDDELIQALGLGPRVD